LYCDADWTSYTALRDNTPINIQTYDSSTPIPMDGQFRLVAAGKADNSGARKYYSGTGLKNW
jgi:hypothetical protein